MNTSVPSRGISLPSSPRPRPRPPPLVYARDKVKGARQVFGGGCERGGRRGGGRKKFSSYPLGENAVPETRCSVRDRIEPWNEILTPETAAPGHWFIPIIWSFDQPAPPPPPSNLWFFDRFFDFFFFFFYWNLTFFFFSCNRGKKMFFLEYPPFVKFIN